MPNTGPDTDTRKRIHVVAGVIVGEHDTVLIALRPDHLHQGGLWEFPGGKVEAGESIDQALTRELREELGIEVLVQRPFKCIDFDYPDKPVRLEFCWVEAFDGQPSGREGQQLQWVSRSDLLEYAFPPANRVIVEALVAD